MAVQQRPDRAGETWVLLDVDDVPVHAPLVARTAVEAYRRGHRVVVRAEGVPASALAALAVATCAPGAGEPLAEGAAASGLDAARAVVVNPGDDLDLALEPLESPLQPTEGGLLLGHGWSYTRRGYDPARVVTVGTNWMTGNGLLGYRGTFAEWRREGFVACVVADTYDTADGKWRELVNAPNGLYAEWALDEIALGVDVAVGPRSDEALEQRFDLRIGRAVRRLDSEVLGRPVLLEEERFASMARRHVIAQRHVVTAPPGSRLRLVTGIDGDAWQLNGEHLPDLELTSHDDEVLVAHGTTAESGVLVGVAQGMVLRGGSAGPVRVRVDGRRILREVELEPGDDGRVVLDLVVAVGSSNDQDLTGPVPQALARIAAEARDLGHDHLLVEQAAAWDRVWDRCDVALDGDPLAQVALRFGIHHNVIATPRHTDHLPIGARGLSCQAYQGAAFWDQEAFNLPMYTWTDPDVARRLLTYRVRTLDGARRKAARLGHRGAYFAWISGDTGDELCPDFFFRDVLSGRWIRNHFNDWQMHISPDVALAVRDYLAVTDDVSFLADGGAELAFEVARFLASFVLRDEGGRDHLVRLLGPDEFHENVDDNAFSNHQSQAALRFALAVRDRLDHHDPNALRAVEQRIGLEHTEYARWADVADRIVLPEPDERGVIEAFEGFHDLEDVAPYELERRLQHPDEYWGWPNGVAVHTQVSKQADVVQLFVAQPSRFPPEVMAANVDHYLPRTSHKSSLSRSAYAIVSARLGRTEEALRLFVASATVDLLAEGDHSPGGTFIGGLRTAAAGVSWSVAALGFAGLRVHDGVLLVDPHLPAAWASMGLAVDLSGDRLYLRIAHDRVEVALDGGAPNPRRVRVGEQDRTMAPGEQVSLDLDASRSVRSGVRV